MFVRALMYNIFQATTEKNNQLNEIKIACCVFVEKYDKLRKWYFVSKIVLTYCEKNCSMKLVKPFFLVRNYKWQ